MIKLFHIDGAMIAQLSDTELRQLLVEIGKAELRRLGINPADFLIAGGHQNAGDEGVDVRLSRIPRSISLAFFQRREAIVQSKAAPMPAGKIRAEMRPKNRLRSTIATLLQNGGAYVIASSKDNLTQPRLEKRLEAMRKALGKTRGTSKGLVDFYDQRRLADYANEYPSVALWVRDTLAEPRFGWEGIGDWSRAVDRTPFAADEIARVRCTDAGVGAEPMTVDAAMSFLRAALQPGHVVRLTGQSGTGKTRLAEALFESTELKVTDVLYADCGADAGPTPRPAEMLPRLVADGRRFVVVLDNCPLNLHQACAPLVQRSQVSLLTIEADVDDDIGQGTVSFHLTPASEGVIEGLLATRAPTLSRLSRERIGNVAGGNARIALALAKKVARSEDISGLPDAMLYRRLYAEGTKNNAALARAAEVCALVYSFNEGADSVELRCLAELAELTVTDLRRQLNTLRKRELIQRRGEMAAFLPQALAHRVATDALEVLTASKVRNELERLSDPRLLHSFARRLGSLADSEEARSLAARWIDELMAHPEAIDANGFKIVTRLAPLAPASAFTGLEKLANSPATNAWRSDSRWATLIRHLGYSVEGFARAVELLIHLVLTERTLFRPENAPLRNALKAMFRVVRSGTLAPPEQRAEVARRLLADGDAQRRALGIELVDAMLDTGPFTSSFDPSFGVEPRSYGWSEDLVRWFKVAADLATYPLGPPELAHELHARLARHIRGLIHAELDDLVIEAAHGILARTRWFDGWAAVRHSLTYETLSPARRTKIQRLERALRPSTVDERLDAYVRARRPSLFKNASSRRQAMRALAQAMTVDSRPIAERLHGCYHERDLGVSLASSSGDVARLWANLVQGYKAESAPRDAGLLAGALDEIQKGNPRVAEEILESALLDTDLLPQFITLQVGDVVLSDTAARRLLIAAGDPRTNINDFRYASGKPLDTLRVEVFVALVNAIAARPDGRPIAFEVLQMRLMAEPPSSPNRSALARCGQALFASLMIDEASVAGLDHILSEVAKAVFVDERGIPVARRLLHDVVAAATTEGVWVTREIKDFLRSLCEAYPTIGLDLLLDATPLRDHDAEYLTWNLRMMEPLHGFDDDTILGWVGESAHRAAQVARIVTLTTYVADGKHALTTLGERLLDVVATAGALPDFEAFERHFIVEETVSRRRVASLEAARDSAVRVGVTRPGLATWTAKLTRRIDNVVADWRESENARALQSFEYD